MGAGGRAEEKLVGEVMGLVLPLLTRFPTCHLFKLKKQIAQKNWQALRSTVSLATIMTELIIIKKYMRQLNFVEVQTQEVNLTKVNS